MQIWAYGDDNTTVSRAETSMKTKFGGINKEGMKEDLEINGMKTKVMLNKGKELCSVKIEISGYKF